MTPLSPSSSSHTAVDHDIIFADDERENNPKTFQFLKMAHAWADAKKSGKAGGSAPLTGFTAAKNNQDDDAKSDVASSHGGDD